MDIQAFLAQYREDGRGGAGYHPEMMVALLLYAYCRGISSSREIERRCVLDVGFRIVMAQQMPDHATISRFRRDFATELSGLFVQVLQLCEKAGLVKLGTVSLDGTKMRANAAMEANVTRDKLQELVQRMLAEAEAIDQAEDELFGKDKRGDELPEHLADPDKRRAALRKARQQLQNLQAAKARADELAQQEQEDSQHNVAQWRQTPPAQRKAYPRKPTAQRLEKIKGNLTDPSSRIQRIRQGYCQGYNAQVVTCENQIILTAELCDAANDMRQLPPMVEALHETLEAAGLDPGRVEHLLADGGYWTSQLMMETLDYLAINDLNAQLLIPPPERWRTLCALGDESPPENDLTPLQQLEHRVSSPAGREIYRLRSETVEPVFGQMKSARNLSAFRLRGFTLANSEWKLITLTHNLLKLFRARDKKPSKARKNIFGKLHHNAHTAAKALIKHNQRSSTTQSAKNARYFPIFTPFMRQAL